ncbi:MAG: hypothetical protein FWE88_05455 [Phycisphaerae bacterium]|nr:hypothetical protein [Phycisphaerae bacterium]
MDKSLDGYEVLLCVSGGIACYKAADLASKLVQAGAGVTVAMTPAAVEFVQPLTFGSLTRRAVFTSMWQSTENHDSGHISLTERADLTILAPATANTIAKLAHGLADNLVSTMLLATAGSCDVLVAPAMNSRMFAHPAVQTNIETLASMPGVHLIGPAEGRLACGTTGPGRMCEPADILARATELLLRHAPKRLSGV